MVDSVPSGNHPPRRGVGWLCRREERHGGGGEGEASERGESSEAEERKVKFAHDNAANFSRKSGNCLRPRAAHRISRCCPVDERHHRSSRLQFREKGERRRRRRRTLSDAKERRDLSVRVEKIGETVARNKWQFSWNSTSDDEYRALIYAYSSQVGEPFNTRVNIRPLSRICSRLKQRRCRTIIGRTEIIELKKKTDRLEFRRASRGVTTWS